MKGGEVNVPLLRKAVEWAEAEATKPEVHSAWYQPDIIVSAEDVGRDCGTCYCIAGYLALLAVGEEEAMKDPIGYAFDALGVEDVEGLFFATNTIEDVRRIAESLAGEPL